jgi:catechol 2,3-dioxygenase-like lactoylglutathione lyase family enzyme
MLHHVSVGVRNVEESVRFYDRVLATLGYERLMEFLPYAAAYGQRHPEFWVQLPADRAPATLGNGVHIAFKARSKAAVEAFHREALAVGGKDEGAAGPRPNYGPDYFGAFVRDLDGNKIEACLVPEPAVARSISAPKRKKKAAKPKRRAAKKRPAKKPRRRK